MAFDPESARRDELRKALERFAADYRGFVPDLRSTAPTVEEQLRRIDEWRSKNACPSTKRTSGACPGFVIDRSDQSPDMHWRAVEK